MGKKKNRMKNVNRVDIPSEVISIESILEGEKPDELNTYLVPMYENDAILRVLKNWQYFSEGMMEINTTSNDMNMSVVLNEILAGKLFIFIGFLDGKYVGFITGKTLGSEVTNMDFFIQHAYIKRGTNYGVYPKWHKDAIKFLKSKGYKRLKCMSGKEEHFAGLERLGYKKSFTEFVLEL